MYLSAQQHDQFRNIVMGFEVPYRRYIAEKIVGKYVNADELKSALFVKMENLQPSDPFFIRDALPDVIKKKSINDMYDKFSTVLTMGEVVHVDKEVPMVRALNIMTFALTNDFQELYAAFTTYNHFCELADKYAYVRNKLSHPMCRTLEDNHLNPVLRFIKKICSILEDRYFIQKSKTDILSDVDLLDKQNVEIPISKHNLSETPYMESQIVCRDSEIEDLKKFIYGNYGDLRKQHSRCVFGYGGVGKTALVVETIKQVVQDIIDKKTINDYEPKYLFFFSAKKSKLHIANATGRIIEQQISSHFETAEELISLIHNSLDIETFKNYHEEGLIVIDNLEALSEDDRKTIKRFVEVQTPTEMQFLITSRNSEDYESNIRLSGFEEESGHYFIESYINENALAVQLNDNEINELLEIAKGNTLVLVLSLRRLSQKLIDISGLKADFSCANIWKELRKKVENLAPNAYESISDFMFRDTFEQIENVFKDTNIFYKILKVFAVTPNSTVDLSTVCLLTDLSYPDVAAAIEVLCNYLIVEKNKNYYSLNQFAETYIVQRFIPDADTYDRLSKDINRRWREIKQALENLEQDMRNRQPLRSIMTDWHILTDSDRMIAAKMYNLHGEVKHGCELGGKFKVEQLINEFIKKSEECERITAHPYIKYQNARILQMIDESKVLDNKHTKEILKNYLDAVYIINTIDQYAQIQNTKSYAALLWLLGQFLGSQEKYFESIRYLEDAKKVFEEQNIYDKQYYQCITQLAHNYVTLYEENSKDNLIYLRKARNISRHLESDAYKTRGVNKHINTLRVRLSKYGKY